MGRRAPVVVRELRPKRVIDRRVAELLGQKVTTISAVTEAFLHEIVRALVDGDEVRLDGLGTMHILRAELPEGKTTILTNAKKQDGSRDVAVVEVQRKYYVRFRKGLRLKEALWARHGRLTTRRTPMEKYGVDESVDGEDLEKKASEGCPECGAKVQRHGNVLVCPTHGTAPFENKKQ